MHGTHGAHPKHLTHGCDAGRVEAQRLVERLRLLPSRKGDYEPGCPQGMYARKALGGSDGAGGMHEKGPTEGWGSGHTWSAP